MGFRVLISAGEASGDLYASRLVAALKARHPDAEFFGCAGPRMRQEGVRAIVDSASLAVVGLIEVVGHLPRIYGEYRKLCRAIETERPDVAILVDSPDFHLRLARRLKNHGVPVVYLVAPQVWAWRQGRLGQIRRTVDELLCIFPFEEEFFRAHGVPATYIGHPLSRLVRPGTSKPEFFQSLGLNSDRPLVALLPGSRVEEIGRHIPALADAVERLRLQRPMHFVLGLPLGFGARARHASFWERIQRASIQVVEGSTWDLLAHADVALAASGTVTIEAALLGTPMVTFYKVAAVSWFFGRSLVRVPYLSMVNLVAGRCVVTELIQDQMSGERLAAEAVRLLDDPQARSAMQRDLAEIAGKLSSTRDPTERAAESIETVLKREFVHAS